ncbi:MAG TPA: acyl-CoA dehydrogenase family protein [Streptosporangiaceae bacterium]|jgi:acyl-CoA dehydrogenase
MTVTDSPRSEQEIPQTRADVMAMVRRIGAAAAPHAARHDREASFTEEGYEAIKASGFGMIAVPKELGGGGHDLGTVCRAQAILARYCANTSLAICMHQHNVLALAWRWRLGDQGVEQTLRRVVTENLIISSSGSADPSNPGVIATPADGGLLVTGRKRFVSGVPGADVVATMAAIDDGEQRWTTTVLIPTSDPGLEIVPEWDSMGMRGSGSNPVAFTDVFVPDDNILDLEPIWSLPGRRSGQDSPPDDPAAPPPDEALAQLIDQGSSGARLPGLQIALTVIAAVYLGAAGAMRDRALRMAARGVNDPARQHIAGLLTHEFRLAWWALDALIAETTDEAVGTEAHFATTMLAKRQVILSSIHIVELAMELLGSRSYMRSLPFEQALRDVRAGITHPLAPEKTLLEIGKSALGFFADQPAR